MITEQQLEQFVTDGAVTIDTPLTKEQVAAASAAFDRLIPADPAHPRAGSTGGVFEPALLEILQHPFFEEVAKRVLRAEEVRFFQTAIVTTYPQPDRSWSFDQHVDIQYRTSDIESVPRQMICSYFLWLTDVTEQRAPMMFRPGSHLLIGAERERDPALKGAVPMVEGVSLARLPALPYAEPIPLTARAGQVSVLTTGAVHGASVNVDTSPRKVMVFTFTPAGVEIGLPSGQAEAKRAYDRELRGHLRPERRHIVEA